jgi:hypothetical protein
MFRPRRPLISVPAFSSALCALRVSEFSSLLSFCSGGSSDPRSSPIPNSFDATISFRITSFAHPNHLTPIESYSCKKQGRGYPALTPAQALPYFSTRSKHPTHSNARLPRAAARGMSTLFMRLLHTSRHTRGWGWDSQSWLSASGLLDLRLTAHVPWDTGHAFSALLRGLCVSALSFSPLSLSSFKHFDLQTSQRRFSTTHYPLLTTHYSPLTVLPRTSTLPPPIYGIIPPHRGVSRSSLTTGRNPIRTRGGFSD